ncbi:hypothetical protein [Pseudanabaena sp. ABRG5-3]|nr:hypothetical protein [Pseudanabaena sp. ABRG5-3]
MTLAGAFANHDGMRSQSQEVISDITGNHRKKFDDVVIELIAHG